MNTTHEEHLVEFYTSDGQPAGEPADTIVVGTLAQAETYARQVVHSVPGVFAAKIVDQDGSVVGGITSAEE